MKRLEWRDGQFVEAGGDGETLLSLPHDVDAVAAVPDLGAVDVIVLTFPAFRDGRAFTQAASLRRAGFRGDIRAKGALFLDQIGMAVRCGFTSFELDDTPTPEEAQRVFQQYAVYYQRSVVGAPIWEASR